MNEIKKIIYENFKEYSVKIEIFYKNSSNSLYLKYKNKDQEEKNFKKSITKFRRMMFEYDYSLGLIVSDSDEFFTEGYSLEAVHDYNCKSQEVYLEGQGNNDFFFNYNYIEFSQDKTILNFEINSTSDDQYLNEKHEGYNLPNFENNSSIINENSNTLRKVAV